MKGHKKNKKSKGTEMEKGVGAREGVSLVGGSEEMDCEVDSSSSEAELEHGKGARRVREGLGRSHEGSDVAGPSVVVAGPSVGIAGQSREGGNVLDPSMEGGDQLRSTKEGLVVEGGVQVVPGPSVEGRDQLHPRDQLRPAQEGVTQGN